MSLTGFNRSSLKNKKHAVSYGRIRVMFKEIFKNQAASPASF
jgi:hypothetical protein